MRNVRRSVRQIFSLDCHLNNFVRHVRLIVQERLKVRLVLLFFRATSKDVKFKKWQVEIIILSFS